LTATSARQRLDRDQHRHPEQPPADVAAAARQEDAGPGLHLSISLFPNRHGPGSFAWGQLASQTWTFILWPVVPMNTGEQSGKAVRTLQRGEQAAMTCSGVSVPLGTLLASVPRDAPG
jgi:hypothetical protein